MSVAAIGPASAATTWVDLGSADSFAVLGATTVINTGPTVLNGDLGVTPGTAIVGFPPGTVTPPAAVHANDGPAISAMADLTTAYLDAAGRTPPDETGLTDLAGRTLVGGLYSGGALSNSGTLILDGQGNADSVWIFQASSTLITAPSSTVQMINGANACNVFWQVSSSATLDTNSTMVGTVMALTSISANTGAVVQGRLLAQTGAVTLDSNTITAPVDCVAPATPGGTPGGGGPTLAASGVDSAPYLIAIVTLLGGGLALLLVSRGKIRSRRSGGADQ